MPADEAVLGFSNRFYPLAFEHAAQLTLPSGRLARCVTPPILIATKLEAFRGPHRAHGGDYMASADMNDIVALLVGRREIDTDIANAPAPIRAELARWAESMTGRNIEDASLNHAIADQIDDVRHQIGRSLVSMIAARP